MLWCPYCKERQPVFNTRVPEIISELNEKVNRVEGKDKHFTLVEWCNKCKSVWLCRPDGKGGFWWDTWALGTLWTGGIVTRRGGSMGLAGIVNTDLKEGHSYVIDPKEAAKSHLVILGETKGWKESKEREKKSLWRRLKSS